MSAETLIAIGLIVLVVLGGSTLVVWIIR